MLYLNNWEEFMTQNEGELEYIKTNTKIDNITNGFVKSGFHLICGASGNGKSMALLHLAFLMAQEHTVLYVSLENAPKIDVVRGKQIVDLYQTKESKIMFLNLNDLANDNIPILSTITQIADRFDIVMIDAVYELMHDTNGDGTDMFVKGNQLCKELAKLAEKNNQVIVGTWQLNRGGYKSKIEDIGMSDVATSIGSVQKASSIWVIQRDLKKHTWEMGCIKSRTGFNDSIEEYSFSVMNNNKFDLRAVEDKSWKNISQQLQDFIDK